MCFSLESLYLGAKTLLKYASFTKIFMDFRAAPQFFLAPLGNFFFSSSVFLSNQLRYSLAYLPASLLMSRRARNALAASVTPFP